MLISCHNLFKQFGREQISEAYGRGLNKSHSLLRYFWRYTKELVKNYISLFKLLRIIDVDRRPSIGFVYDMLEHAKDEIRAPSN